MAAALALYRRGGTDAVTLSAVAREADFARGVVYAHFARRQELVSEVERAAPPPAASPDMRATANDAERATAESYDALMKAQAEVLQDLSSRVIVAKPAPRDATETALSRLDTRMAVTEKSVAALEQRFGERLKNLDTETGALAEHLHGLRQRLEKFEARQTAALAQLRLDVHNLGRDGAHNTHRDEPSAEMLPVEEPPDAVDAAVDTAAEPESDTPADEAAEAGGLADYLASARRSAIDAAERQAAAQPVKRKPTWRRLLGKRRWAVLAAFAALVAWFDVYVFAHYSPAQGAAVAVDVPTPVVKKPTAVAHVDWSPRAQLVRGLKYLNGIGVPVDLAKARLWIERAALRGQPVAQNLMGVLNQTGTGAPADMAVAIGWYEGAAKLGNLKAMTNLGKVYAGGWAEGTDFTKAAEWFTKAAALGDVDAAFDLAILYERGLGVSRNLAQAYKWYAIAGAHGDGHAATRAATLSGELSPEERDAADAAVAAFRPAPLDTAANDVPVSGA